MHSCIRLMTDMHECIQQVQCIGAYAQARTRSKRMNGIYQRTYAVCVRVCQYAALLDCLLAPASITIYTTYVARTTQRLLAGLVRDWKHCSDCFDGSLGMQACQENGGSIGKAALVNQSRIAVQGAGAILNCDGESCSPTDNFGITRYLELQILLGTIRLYIHVIDACQCYLCGRNLACLRIVGVVVFLTH